MHFSDYENGYFNSILHELLGHFNEPSVFRIFCHLVANLNFVKIKTNARSDGDDYIINGSKFWITNGHNADWCCLLVNTNDGPVHKSKSLICVPMDSPGVVRGKRIEKIGMKSSDTAQLFFEDVRVPKKNIIGKEGKGFIYQMQQFQQERIYAVAITLKALEMSINTTIEVS